MGPSMNCECGHSKESHGYARLCHTCACQRYAPAVSAYKIRPEEIRTCASAECVALASPPAATLGVRADGTCYRCHGATREANETERAEYVAWILARENPARTALGMRTLALEPDEPDEPDEPEPRPTVTCSGCGLDFLDRDTVSRSAENDGGNYCAPCAAASGEFSDD